MIDIRKTGLTVMALGLMAAPAMAGSAVGSDATGDSDTISSSKLPGGHTAGTTNDINSRTSTDDTTTGESGVTGSTSFKTYDTDSDGLISEDEFAASAKAGYTAETFGELDVNGNGTLDEAEFDTLVQTDHETDATAEAIR